jgi:hypothetical protein
MTSATGSSAIRWNRAFCTASRVTTPARRSPSMTGRALTPYRVRVRSTSARGALWSTVTGLRVMMAAARPIGAIVASRARHAASLA